MADPRNRDLARTLVNYSLQVKPGEIVALNSMGVDGLELVHDMVEQVTLAGGVPYVLCNRKGLYSAFDEAQVRDYSQFFGEIAARFDAYCVINTGRNPFEDANQSIERRRWWGEYYRKAVTDPILRRERWVVVRYPNEAMASGAKMSTRAFQEHYYRVCAVDYGKMAEASLPLKRIMEQTGQVHIKGPGRTDLRFSIRNMPAIQCDGRFNLPDGECFTCPVRESMNGIIEYNTPAEYMGNLFRNIVFEVENGRIVRSGCQGDEKKLNEILDLDEGARYFGEWSLAYNPFILEPIQDILFDEKIAGSFHLTPGNAYEVCDNGNKSMVHWDLVCIQRPEYGGGEIRFDGTLIRKDGMFVLPELAGLNPEALG